MSARVDETDAVAYVGEAIRGRLDDLGLLQRLAMGGYSLDQDQRFDVLDLDRPASAAEVEDAAVERLAEYPLCIERMTMFEIVLGTGGPDDRFLVECDGGVEYHGVGGDTPYEISSILYRYSWSGSGERVLTGDDFEVAEQFARQVVPELVE